MTIFRCNKYKWKVCDVCGLSLRFFCVYVYRGVCCKPHTNTRIHHITDDNSRECMYKKSVEVLCEQLRPSHRKSNSVEFYETDCENRSGGSELGQSFGD